MNMDEEKMEDVKEDEGENRRRGNGGIHCPAAFHIERT